MIDISVCLLLFRLYFIAFFVCVAVAFVCALCVYYQTDHDHLREAVDCQVMLLQFSREAFGVVDACSDVFLQLRKNDWASIEWQR